MWPRPSHRTGTEIFREPLARRLENTKPKAKLKKSIEMTDDR
jgi:hypothetical protein